MESYLQETARELAAEASLQLPGAVTREQLEILLAQQLERLISNNFQQFVFLLYKVDVSEKKVREVLDNDSSPEAFRKIAALLIERQLQKVQSKAMFNKPAPDDGEEKW